MAALRQAGRPAGGRVFSRRGSEPAWPPHQNSVTIPYDPPAGRSGTDYVAVVVATRPYAAVELMSALVRHQFSAVERGRADSLAFVAHLQPQLIVAVIDPSNPDDLGALRILGRSSDARILVVSPGRHGTVPALRAGADVVVDERAGFDVLDAQLAAVRRRLDLERTPGGEDGVVEAGPIRMDKNARQAFAAGTRLELTNMEFSLLLTLVEDQGHVISPLQAARRSSGRLVTEEEANQTIKVYIRRLRQKLHEAGCNPAIIANVRGRGYMLDPLTRDLAGSESAIS